MRYVTPISHCKSTNSGSIGPQIGYALKWIIPIWIVLAVVIVSLWFSGYGVASIPTAVYQSQFFEYSQENALDWYTDTYYCNRTITTPENSTDFFFTVLPETQQPGYGCTLANSVGPSSYTLFLATHIILEIAMLSSGRA